MRYGAAWRGRDGVSYSAALAPVSGSIPSSTRMWANFSGSASRRSRIIARSAAKPVAVKNRRGSLLCGSSAGRILYRAQTHARSVSMIARATNAEDDAAIRSTLASYNDALNGGETAAVLPLYTDDGVFMPPYSQSAVGKDA
jgi:hypothetical protein